MRVILAESVQRMLKPCFAEHPSFDFQELAIFDRSINFASHSVREFLNPLKPGSITVSTTPHISQLLGDPAPRAHRWLRFPGAGYLWSKYNLCEQLGTGISQPSETWQYHREHYFTRSVLSATQSHSVPPNVCDQFGSGVQFARWVAKGCSHEELSSLRATFLLKIQAQIQFHRPKPNWTSHGTRKNCTKCTQTCQNSWYSCMVVMAYLTSTRLCYCSHSHLQNSYKPEKHKTHYTSGTISHIPTRICYSSNSYLKNACRFNNTMHKSKSGLFHTKAKEVRMHVLGRCIQTAHHAIYPTLGSLSLCLSTVQTDSDHTMYPTLGCWKSRWN